MAGESGGAGGHLPVLVLINVNAGVKDAHVHEDQDLPVHGDMSDLRVPYPAE